MYHIGKLAKLADVTTDTIRFYEKQGLMERPNRTESGYRLYGKKIYNVYVLFVMLSS